MPKRILAYLAIHHIRQCCLRNSLNVTNFGISIDKQQFHGYCFIFISAPPPPTCESKVDLCIVIDSSGSIRDNNVAGQPDNWQLQIEFLTTLVRAFTIGTDATRVGAIVFSEDVRLAFPLSAYDNAEDVATALSNIAYMGQTTNTPEALVQTRTACFSATNGDRPDVPNLAIIITDGVPFPDNRRTPALNEAKALRDTGATAISIGVTNNIDVDFLKGLSSSPQLEGQNYFTATDFATLDEIQKSVVEGTCEALEGTFVYFALLFLPHGSCLNTNIKCNLCVKRTRYQLFLLSYLSWNT